MRIGNKCNKCREARYNFSKYDKKYNNNYCPPILGFSSDIVGGRIELMIIAESHGGGRDWTDLPNDDEGKMEKLKEYYLKDNIVKFHQYSIRKLLNYFDKKRVSWFFTDLIKCFVSKKGKGNMDTAADYCFSFLKKQIFEFKPEKIILLGKRVQEKVISELAHEHLSRLGKAKQTKIHGNSFEAKISDGKGFFKTKLVLSIFPSARTADYWVSSGEWEPIIKAIS